MKSQTSILIHFDQHAEALTAAQFGCELQRVIACFAGLSCTLAAAAEIVTRSLDRITQETEHDLHAWHDSCLSCLPDDACAVTVVLSAPECGVAVIGGHIARHPMIGAGMVGHEQLIRLTIDRKLWRMVNQSLLACIAEMCARGTVTYAAIDREGVAPKSIYQANFRLLAHAAEAAQIDAETRIPGLYWAQYWSSAMLTEDVRQALTADKRLNIRETGNGLWVQTADSIAADTAEAHQAVYRIIQPQTYAPDEAVLMKYKRLLPWLFDCFPIEISAEIR